MKNSQYIGALKKALANMDKKSREDILLEIKSHAEESGADDFSLLERFGSPEELAQQYLDEAPTTQAKTSWFTKIILYVGVFSLSLVIIIATIFYFFTQDDFDYSNEQASELNINTSDWNSQKAPENLKINLNQSKATFYWHAKETIHWNCKGRDSDMKPVGNTFDIDQGRCLVFLPQQAINFQVSQANAVLVRPQANVTINVEQGSLKIAENETDFNYKINSTDANVEEFNSNSNAAVTIDIIAKQSSIQHYEY